MSLVRSLTLPVALAAGLLAIGFAVSNARAGAPAPAASPLPPRVCGTTAPTGPLAELPRVEVGKLPLNDRNEHELILRTVHDGDIYCFRSVVDGIERNAPPVLRMHRGEHFALRLVNELNGPAPGAAVPASALERCGPPAMDHTMMAIAERPFAGYLGHTMYERRMPLDASDVNMHFHGFIGAADVENIFQSTLSTPMHACEYSVTIPHDQPPGTYYYHPHAHGAAEAEVDGGLAGMWIVEPDAPQIAANADHPVVLDYAQPAVDRSPSLVDDGVVFAAGVKHEAAASSASHPVPYDPFDPPMWPLAFPMHAGNVREASCGDRSDGTLAANGTLLPASLEVAAGAPQLVRLLNGTGDSLLFLHLRDAKGNERPLQVVGRDGTPVGDDAHPLARYEAMNEAPMVPAQRLDLLVTAQPGDVLTLWSAPHCNAPFDAVQLETDILTIRAVGTAHVASATASTPIDPARARGAALVRFARAHAASIRKRAIAYTEYVVPSPGGKGGESFYAVTDTTDRAFEERGYWPTYARGASVPDANVVVRHGTVEEWTIFNTTAETHSFHIHQMNFVAEDGLQGPATLDTVDIPAGTLLPNPSDADYPLVKASRTRVLLDFRNVPRGTFVFHCHMLHHEDRGMMAVIRVE